MKRIPLILLAALFVACTVEDPTAQLHPAPTITSLSWNADNSSVTLSAKLSDGGAVRDCGFVLWPSDGAMREVSASMDGDAFMAQVDSLSYEVQYFFKAYISSGNERIESSQESFTIRLAPPLIAVNAVRDKKKENALVQYSIDERSSGNLYACGLCWDTSPAPSINSSNKTSDDAIYGYHLSLIGGLEAGTTYYIRAWASSEKGTYYSDDFVFSMPVWIEDPVLRRLATEAADINGDKEISIEEAAALQSLEVCSDSIASLEGISWFTALRKLSCTGSGARAGLLKEADLGSNIALESIDLSGNILKDVTLPQVSETLRSIDLSHNRLLNADLSGYGHLTSANLSYNSLAAVSFDNLPALETADLSHNSLKSFEATESGVLHTLLLQDNDLYSISLPEDVSLSALDISHTSIPDINTVLRSYRGIKDLRAQGMFTDENKIYLLDKLERLDCSGSDFTVLSLKYNSHLKSLVADSCKFHTLNLMRNDSLRTLHCVSPKLDTLYLMEDQLIEGVNTGEEATGLSTGTIVSYTLRIEDAVFNSYLTSNFDTDSDGIVSCAEAKNVSRIQISSSTYSGISSMHGIEMFSSLTYLSVPAQKFTSIDLSQCPDLEFLGLDSVPLEHLDLGAQGKLKQLYLQGSTLKSIDFTPLVSLEKACLMNSSLEGTLDLSACLSLSKLDIRLTAVTEVILPEGSTASVTAPNGCTVSYR